jgi:small subunit ribosomal protein S9
MEPAKAQEPKRKASPPKTPKKITLGHGVGRRKSAVARVWLRRGSGKLSINGKDSSTYFDTEITRLTALVPFNVKPRVHYDAEANVQGGGVYAQADAVKLGLSRALLSANSEFKPLLRQHGLLTVDSRLKERKKYGRKAARRRFQFVKR